MLPAQRQQCIIDILEKLDYISVQDLSNELCVSHMTVRRDIKELERKGLLVLVSGGVQSIKKIYSEPSHNEKATLNAQSKDLIGRIASKLIPLNSCIYLDAGTTSLALCKYIVNRDDLTIVTNDFGVLNYLVEHSFENLIHVGGHVRSKNLSSVGYLAANTIKLLRFDIAFLSSSSFDDTTVTTPDSEKVIVKQAVIANSVKKILISDSSKYPHVASFVAFPIDAIDVLITDKNLPQKAKQAFLKQNIDVITE